MRTASIKRSTKETEIDLTLNLDGSGISTIDTGIGFFDHMLTLFAKHGLFDLSVIVKGDLEVDSHHTIEDVGIVLGQAISEALGDKRGIVRYGSMLLPMDETLVLCALDCSGRPFLSFEGEFSVDSLGMYDTEMVEEFFRAVCTSGGINMHLQLLKGKNNHHKIEAMHKAFARSLDMATQFDSRVLGVPSTKGVL